MMSKRIILTIFVIVALLCTSVYATSALTPTVTADDLTSTPVVGTETPTTPANGNELTPTNTAEDLQNVPTVGTQNNENDIMPISEDGQDYVIPEEWARDVDQNMWRGEEATGSTISEDYFTASSIVEISNKTVDGNAFIAGETVRLNQFSIYGDTFVAGENVNLQNMHVIGSLYVAGANISLDKVDISGNLYIAGDKLNVSQTTVQDVFAAGNVISVSNSSNVIRSINAAGSSITLGNTTVGRNANLEANTIDTSEAIVSGKLNSNIIKEDVEEEQTSKVDTIAYSVVSNTVRALLVCGFIFLFARGYIERQKTDKLTVYLLKNTAKGFGLVFLIPIIAVLLLFTGVAIGLSFALIAIYIIILFISTSLISVTIATAAIGKNTDSSWKLYGISVLTALVLALLQQIPFIGGLISVLIGFTGMGLILPPLQKNKKEEVVTPTTAE